MGAVLDAVGIAVVGGGQGRLGGGGVELGAVVARNGVRTEVGPGKREVFKKTKFCTDRTIFI